MKHPVKTAFPKLLLFFALVLCFQINKAGAQAPPSDAAYLQQSVQQLTTTYRNARGGHAHLYNGTEYVSSDKYHLIGHPDFMVDTLVTGAVFYDGSLYENIPLLYDLREDELVIHNYHTNLKIRLIKDKVEHFTLNGHYFRKYAKDTIAEASLESGFYDVLQQGSVNLIVKRIKTISEAATTRGLTGEYLYATKFFIQKNGRYYPVKSKSSVLKILPGNKSQLQKQLRANKLKFRRNREEAIQTMVQYYNANPPKNMM